MRDIFGRDTWSSVLDVTLDYLIIAGKTERYPAFRRVFDGIIEKIGNNFAEAIGIDVDVIKWPDCPFAACGLRSVNNMIGADNVFHCQTLLLGCKAQIVR